MYSEKTVCAVAIFYSPHYGYDSTDARPPIWTSASSTHRPKDNTEDSDDNNHANNSTSEKDMGLNTPGMYSSDTELVSY